VRAGKAAVGVGVKSISRRIDVPGFRVESSAWAFDAGVFLALANRSTLAFAAQNIGPGARFEHEGPAGSSPFGAANEGAREPLPLTVRAGGVHPVGRLGFAWEAAKARDERAVGSAGVEVLLARTFALRAGLRYQRFIDVGAGFGVERGPLSFDYGFSPRVDLGVIHRATFGVKF
jgi:hypothetical protein